MNNNCDENNSQNNSLILKQKQNKIVPSKIPSVNTFNSNTLNKTQKKAKQIEKFDNSIKYYFDQSNIKQEFKIKKSTIINSGKLKLYLNLRFWKWWV